MLCKAETLEQELSFERLLKREDQGMNWPHFHNAYEIYYLQDGSRGYDFKDKSFNVKKGDLILIKEGVKHQTFVRDKSYFNRFLVKFKADSLGQFGGKEADLLSNFKKDYYHLRLEINDRMMIENILTRMEMESKKNDFGRKIYLKLLISELLILINRYLKSKNNQGSRDHYHLKIMEIMKFIEDNFSQNFSLNQLAAKFSYSSSYLSTLFKEKTGYTVTEYINSVRIKEAQNLLLKNKYNVSQVAEKVGYNNLIHFGRNFKDRTGLSPSDYRKAYK